MKTQVDAVVEAMERNGGFATLRYLYDNVRVATWKTKTPQATMRRIVQTSGEFFRIKPGLWALESWRSRLPASVLSLAREPDQGARIEGGFSHSYYQGLAVELGNLRGNETFVPAQDSGRPFLERKLKDVATRTTLPQFTYRRVLDIIRSIDVIWFNRRGFPSAAIEVEYTTDFRGAFMKFHELVDFRTAMIAIADSPRRRQFDDVLGRDVFKELHGRVAFMSFDELAAAHSRHSALSRWELPAPA